MIARDYAGWADNDKVTEHITNVVFNDQYYPYFCANVRSKYKQWTDEARAICKTRVRKFIDWVQEHGLEPKYVQVEGNYYGEDHKGYFIVESKSRKGQFLLIKLDIIHEV